MIDGKTVLGLDLFLNDVGFYKYPAGGTPTRKLKSKVFSGPHGAAIGQ